MTTKAPIFSIQRSSDRYCADHGWLKTCHSFSFADYFDPNNVHWGALRVLNDDHIAAGQGFPPHPHRDMEIVTYVLEGQLEHQDSMGNRGVVAPGGIQYMSAGTGVRHSEFNHSPTQPLHLVQMWVLPSSTGLAPLYGQREFSVDDRRNRWLLVASGRMADSAAPIALRQDAAFSVTRLENATLNYTFDPDRLAFLFVAHGKVTANGEHLYAGDAVRIASLLEIAVEGSGELLLWDIPPVDESA